MGFLLIVLGTAVTLLLFAQVWLRYIFNLPLLWVEEVALVPAFWLYMMGAAYGSYERSHIKMDIVQVFIKNLRMRLIMRFVAALIAFALAGLFTHWGYDLFVWDLETCPRTNTLLMPFLYAHSSMFICGILMCIYFLIEAIDFARQAFQKKAPIFEKKE